MKGRVISDATATLYCDLMEEIKRRTRVIHSLLNAQLAVPRIVGVEICYLQLRFICELIALACLTAHGDIPGAKAKRLTKAYHPNQILQSLEYLHSSFYPVPGRQILNEAGKVVEVVAVDDPYLTKAELLHLYGECGNFLHRGSLENIMKGKKIPDLERIRTWFEKVRVLLNHHQIQLADPDWQLWVIMHGDTDGKVHATQFHRVGDSPTA